jgi:predicted RND superfamily exporter protein
MTSIIGIYQIKTSGSPIEDMPKDKAFFKDIRFFEQEFNAIMPIEIVIDTKRPNGVLRPSNLKQMDALSQFIEETPELSKPISVVNLAKYAKQAYYNNLPKYYQLPTSQERGFILSAAQGANTDQDILKNFTDSTGQVARLSTCN